MFSVHLQCLSANGREYEYIETFRLAYIRVDSWFFIRE